MPGSVAPVSQRLTAWRVMKRRARDEEARGEFFLGEAVFASGLGQGVFKQDHGGFPLIGAWAAGFDPAACLRLSRDAP